jgi:hypothetical protein
MISFTTHTLVTLAWIVIGFVLGWWACDGKWKDKEKKAALVDPMSDSVPVSERGPYYINGCSVYWVTLTKRENKNLPWAVDQIIKGRPTVFVRLAEANQLQAAKDLAENV